MPRWLTLGQLKKGNVMDRCPAPAGDGEVDGLRRGNQQLTEQVAHLQIQNDQYQRLLTAQRGTGPEPR